MELATRGSQPVELAAKDAAGSYRSDIASLLRFSARIGRDPLLIQASSGNTSLKRNGTLWVKASGKWLAKADQQEILVPVSLSECLECLEEGKPLPICDPAADGDTGGSEPRQSCLRPSVETFMHAVLPQRFVIHVHCIETLAWAVRSDAMAQLTKRLAGLRWKWIPYVPSGVPLAREVQSASSRCPETGIFILGNHGLVVCGETCEEAASVLSQVQRRLAVQPRPAPKPDFRVLEHLKSASSWRLPDLEILHTLGTDAISRRIVEGGVLYPCQAMFFGRRLPILRRSENLSGLERRIDRLDTSCPFLIIEGAGILISNNITAAEHAVLTGFTEVVRRIEASAPIRYLTESEVDSILTADAHGYPVSGEAALREA